MVYFVYILHSALKDRYYIGHTMDLEKRIEEHKTRNNLGTNDWKVVYTEVFAIRAEAMLREQEIKSKKRRAYIQKLINAQ